MVIENKMAFVNRCSVLSKSFEKSMYGDVVATIVFQAARIGFNHLSDLLSRF